MSTLKTNKIQTATDSDLTLDTASYSKRIIIPKSTGDDVDLDALSGRLIIGDPAAGHMAMDANEIQAKSNPTTAANLYLMPDGGNVGIGTSDPKVPLDILEMGGLTLGYTALNNNDGATNARIEVGTSFAVPNANWKVTFKAPKSGKVEIQLSVYARSDGSDYLYLGLSSAESYNSTGLTKHENLVWESDEDDDAVITPSWLLTGLSAGTSYTYYIGAKSHGSGGFDSTGLALDYGGTNALYRQHAIIRAVSVPNTVHTD